MTYQEIVDKYNAVKREYEYEKRNVTSTQLSSFKEQFAEKKGIVFIDDFDFRFRRLFKLDEICYVRNVEETVEYVEVFGILFYRTKKVNCFKIYLRNGYTFLTKSEQARELSRGQRIRIHGDVAVGWDNGYVLSDGHLSVSPRPKPFGMEFEVI